MVGGGGGLRGGEGVIREGKKGGNKMKMKWNGMKLYCILLHDSAK